MMTVKKSELILYKGDEKRGYCAFPSIVEKDGLIHCMLKQGNAHMRDDGIITRLIMKKNGDILAVDRVMEPPSGACCQNVELLEFPDGTLRYFVDIQDKVKPRLGMRYGRVTEDGFLTEDGIFSDSDGVLYGYAFDGASFAGGYVLAAMTFPELEYENPRKCVRLLLTDGSGSDYKNVLTLDDALGDSVNETSVCVYKDRLYMAVRGYGDASYFAVCDGDFSVCGISPITEAKDGIQGIGRPKLFTYKDGLFCIMRTHEYKGGPMALTAVRIDPDTLDIVGRVTLDDTPTADGHYAEPYFDGDYLCVVDYRYVTSSAQPAIILMRFPADILP